MFLCKLLIAGGMILITIYPGCVCVQDQDDYYLGGVANIMREIYHSVGPSTAFISCDLQVVVASVVPFIPSLVSSKKNQSKMTPERKVVRYRFTKSHFGVRLTCNKIQEDFPLGFSSSCWHPKRLCILEIPIRLPTGRFAISNVPQNRINLGQSSTLTNALPYKMEVEMMVPSPTKDFLLILRNSSLEIHTNLTFKDCPCQTKDMLLRKGKEFKSQLKGFSKNNCFKAMSNNISIFIEGESELLASADPFTLASWIGIVTAYMITVLIFGTLKSLTMNSMEQMLCHYVFSHLRRIMFEKKGKIGTDMYNHKDESHSQCHLASITDDVENNEYRKDVIYEEKICRTDNQDPAVAVIVNHAKPSIAIFHSTIRIVTFLLIVACENELFSMMSIAKSNAFKTPTNQPQNEDGWFCRLKNEDRNQIEFRREIPQSLAYGSSGSMKSSQGAPKQESSSRLGTQSGLNAKDCINWLQSGGSESNVHACVGYDFDLKGLHKTHRISKPNVQGNQPPQGSPKTDASSEPNKGNKRLMPRMKMQRSLQKPSVALRVMRKSPFKLMETSLMQLWNVAETVFSDSSSSSSSNLITIKDYSGLLLIFVLLSSIATVVFIGEIIFGRNMKGVRNENDK